MEDIFFAVTSIFKLGMMRHSNDGEAKFLYSFEPQVFNPSLAFYNENTHWKYNLWSCIHDTLEKFVEKNDILEEEKKDLFNLIEVLYTTTLESHSNLTTKIQAFDAKNKFKKLWTKVYSTGLKNVRILF